LQKKVPKKHRNSLTFLEQNILFQRTTLPLRYFYVTSTLLLRYLYVTSTLPLCYHYVTSTSVVNRLINYFVSSLVKKGKKITNHCTCVKKKENRYSLLDIEYWKKCKRFVVWCKVLGNFLVFVILREAPGKILRKKYGN
jgi:hypothetical protein